MTRLLGRAWPVLFGMLLIASFGVLEFGGAAPAAVRSSFTLVGLIDCGQKSGKPCSLGQTLTLVSDDSGSKQPYTIDLSWVRDKLPGAFSQDQQMRIEIERLPDSTLMALRVIDLDSRNGTRPDDEGPQPASSAAQRKDDDTFVAQSGDGLVIISFAAP